MVLLSQVMRETAITGRPWAYEGIWGRQGAQWAERTARAAFAGLAPDEAVRRLEDLQRRDVITAEESELLRARITRD